MTASHFTKIFNHFLWRVLMKKIAQGIVRLRKLILTVAFLLLSLIHI